MTATSEQVSKILLDRIQQLVLENENLRLQLMIRDVPKVTQLEEKTDEKPTV